MAKIVYATPTTGTTYTVPSGVTTITVKGWAPGGGGSGQGSAVGGGGGFVQATLTVTALEDLTVRVGDGGAGASPQGGGGGGGYTGLFRSATPLVVVGAGGGAGLFTGADGGKGGDTSGTLGLPGSGGEFGGGGGTPVGGGGAGTNGTPNAAAAGASLAGGIGGGANGTGGGAGGTNGGGAGRGGTSGTEYGGGGGGAGYFGGGGGSGRNAATFASAGGGGGSSYTTGTGTINTQAPSHLGANQGDVDYAAGVGNGGTTGAGVGTAGQPGRFVIIEHIAPNTPDTPNPADAATNVAPATLTWAANGATTYDVYFGTNPTTPPLVSSGQAAASYAPTIADGITYYWRIDAINAYGSALGPIWSFTAAKPATPNTPSPATLSTNQSFTPTLSWVSALATTYDVYFGTSANPPIVSTGQVPATYGPGIIDGLTTYYWKIVAINPAGTTTGPVWSFTTHSETRLVMTIGGATPRTRIASVPIRDLINDAPNTCSYTVDTTPPTVWQEVKIALGLLTTPYLIFAGTVDRVDQFYEGRPTHLAWRVTCQDYTRTLNRRKVRKRYAQQSATAIVLNLVSSYTSGFTTAGVVSGLPTVTGGIDFTEEDVSTCFSRLASRIGGYWYLDYGKDVHFFLMEATAAPDDLVP